ncbi:amidase domain-containing protein [Cohnella soli]|uniref:Amidase domain-containing protein n=1 Tax=Cohnella soli TaxID=425005 RepID=A0ABW0HUM4_9BACL
MRTWFRIGLIALVAFQFPLGVSEASARQPDNQELTVFLNRAIETRGHYLILGEKVDLDTYYIRSDKSSMAALEHEKKRHRYLDAWALKRNLQFIDCYNEIRIVRYKVQADTANVVFIVRQRLGYVNMKNMLQPQRFGLGTRHVMTLKKKKNEWRISREWYLDPLDENPALIADHQFHPENAGSEDRQDQEPKRHDSEKTRARYDRDKAVRYADKYAGLAWGAGNNNRYNQKYRDYTGVGGDCTNFVSQVLGDPEEGGGLPLTPRWYAGPAGGSEAWVRTDGLKHFLLNSGYARLKDKGTFEHIVKQTNEHPLGAIRELRPGDLIGYELKKGDVDHFSVIVGFDDNGYPLVNCHTTDRYRVPFDLGWDKKTNYLLFSIK